MFKSITFGLFTALIFALGWVGGEREGFNEGYGIGYEAGYDAAQSDYRQRKLKFVSDYIIQKESSGIHNRWSETDYIIPAYGIAQFQKRTFNWMKGLAGKPELQWKNEVHQRWLLEWALENGYGKHWGQNYTKAVKAYYEMQGIS